MVQIARHHVRFGRTKRIRIRKSAFQSDDEDAGGSRHGDVLRAVAHIGGARGSNAQSRERQAQGLGIGLARADILAADDPVEASTEVERRELALDPYSAAARHQSRGQAGPAQTRESGLRARQETHLFRAVQLDPSRVGLTPAIARESDRLVGAVPVGGIGRRKARAVEGDSVGVEQPDVGSEAGLRGVDQCAVPVEESGAERTGQRTQRFSIGTKSRSFGPRYT